MASDDRVLAALREGRARLEQRIREPIAIVGIGCRFPGGVRGPADLRDLVFDEVDAVDEQPEGRWDVGSFYDANPEAPGKAYVTRGGFIDRVDTFDADFFGISPREAAAMDPQQRMLLEVAWEGLEHGGITAETVRRSRTGVFIGYSWRDYDRVSVGSRVDAVTAYSGLGNTPSIAAGRLAHFLDLTGPVSVVDTACSSSLVAVHQAAQALRARECDMALAGGVNLILSPFSTVFCCKIRALSTDGRCKTFDASADGYGRAEGCGVVVLKRLSDARSDGDFVHAVILGSAVCHDGHTAGLTVPSGPAQQIVIRAALEAAAASPDQVGYVEAHGTGTALGDPIEVGALNAVFDRSQRSEPLWVGSIKTNIGHAETAAGIAGLIKVVVALNDRRVPRSLHCQQLNPHIDWSSGPVRVASSAQPWPVNAPLAGVSSFGFSGTNAHVLLGLAEPVEMDPPDQALSPIVVISGRSPRVLERQCERYASALQDCPDAAFGRFCRTANTRRTPFEHRVAVLASSPEMMSAALSAVAAGERATDVLRGHDEYARHPKVGMLFAHRRKGVPALGRDLYERSAAVRGVVERCVLPAEQIFGPTFTDLLFRPLSVVRAAADPALADVVAFVHQLAIASEILRWGVQIAVVSGFGTGEFVAGVVSGILDVEEAIGALGTASKCESDGIVVCAGSIDSVQRALDGIGATITGRRDPEYLVHADRASADILFQAIEAAGCLVNRNGDARHILRSNLTRGTDSRAVSIPFGTAEFTIVNRESVPENYWNERPLWLPVDADIPAMMHRFGCTVVIEPSATSAALSRHPSGEQSIRWIHAGPRPIDLARCAGQLFACGSMADLRGFHGGAGLPVPVPTYPFEPTPYWSRTESHNETSESDNSEPPAGHEQASPVVAMDAHAVTEAVTHHVRAILERDANQPIDPEVALHHLGFDSLMAVELRDQLNRRFGITLDAGFAFTFPTISEQAAAVSDLLIAASSPVGRSSADSDTTPWDPSIDGRETPLTKDDVVALALAELSELEAELRD